MTFTKRQKTAGLITLALSAVTVAIFMSVSNLNSTNDIPLPFGFDNSSSPLTGAISEIGKKSGISVKKVTFPNGTDSETLIEDSLYLVVVPDDQTITETTLDDALTVAGVHSVNYFGYKYSSATAAAEKANKTAPILTERFPGQFFASAKARAEDVQNGGSILAFESTNGITMAATDTATGALLSRNSLYFFIVNEASGALLTVRQPAPEALLTVTGKSIASSDTVVANAPDVRLLRFEARASDSADILFTGVSFEAATGFSLANAENFTLWADTNDDGTVDTIQQQGVASQNGGVLFDSLVGGGRTIAQDTAVLFEVHADIASSLVGTNPLLALRFATGSVFIQAEKVTGGASLVGMTTLAPGGETVPSNGTYVAAGANAEISVTTVLSTLFTLKDQGDLFVSKSPTPVRARQLLAGTLESEILRLQFQSSAEDIDVTDIVLTASGVNATSVSSQVDRLELYKVGEVTPFAIATIAACGSASVPDNSMCVSMNAQELVVPKNANTSILVRPFMKSDVDGAISSTRVAFYIDPLASQNSVKARGVVSSNTLSENNEDNVEDGEIFIGRTNVGSNDYITGSMNRVVLAKLASITNINPNVDGTAVPTGIASIGEFRFTTAANTNTQNGLNKWVLNDIIFNVSSANITFGSGDQTQEATSVFKVYNKADPTQKLTCLASAANPTGPSVTVICQDIPTQSSVNSAIDSDANQTFVLEAEISNPQVNIALDSMLQVSLSHFDNINATAIGDTFNQTHITWFDDDSGGQTFFHSIESSETVVNSTLYGSDGAPMVCGDGTKEASEACDDGDTDAGDGCSATCTIESGFACTGNTPSVCSGICGDGLIKGSEACDDNDTDSGDGCSSTCVIESGFSCTGEPSVCTEDPLLTLTTLSLPAQRSSHTGTMVPLVRFTVTTGVKAVAMENLVFTGVNGVPPSGSDTAYMLAAGAAEGDYNMIAAELCVGGPEELLCENVPSSVVGSLPANGTYYFQLYGMFGATQTGISLRLAASANEALAYAMTDDGANSIPLTSMSTNGICQTASCHIALTTLTSTEWTIGGAHAAPVCGDTIIAVNDGEDCDDGNQIDADFCSNQCTLPVPPATCGNGNVEAGETCDDADTSSGDGCSATCAIESGFSCTGEPSVCTPDPVCGNGDIEAGETCDDGDTDSGDGCTNQCAVENEFHCSGEPSTCVTYLNFVKELADTNNDETVSENEALILTLNIADAPEQPYNDVSQYDIDNDGDVDNVDVGIILAQLDILVP